LAIVEIAFDGFDFFKASLAFSNSNNFCDFACIFCTCFGFSISN